MKKIIHVLSTPYFPAALTAPLVLWLAVLVAGIKISPSEAVSAVSFKAFYSVLLLSSLVSTLSAARGKRYGSALMGAGLFCILLQGAAAYAFHFSARTGIGEGETAGSFYAVEAGPWARQSGIPVTFVRVQPGLPRKAVIMINGKEQEVEKNHPFSWGGYRLNMTALSMAPLIFLQDRTGTVLEAGYMKLAIHDDDPLYFQFPSLPHRFHISLPGSEAESWKMSEGSWKRTDGRTGSLETDPENLHLKITRGKLTLLDREVKRGETAAFEEYAVRFEQGAPWAEFEVARIPSFKLLYLGSALLLAGALRLLFLRRPA